MNIDHVYTVDHFVRPGETMSSENYNRFAGGKGFNQSVALGYAGANVYHAGKIGADGLWLQEFLKASGVNTNHVMTSDGSSGHAIIQVTTQGENSIILYGGANQEITPTEANTILDSFEKGDYLLLQNEISATAEIMNLAHARGIKIAINPAPMNESIFKLPLDLVDLFIVNEIEGKDLTEQTKPMDIITAMKEKFPKAAVVLTLGGDGVMYSDPQSEPIHVAGKKVSVVDTTAAGDTFIGYFFATLLQGNTPQASLELANKAASITVTRNGAAESIPKMSELV